MTDSHNSKDEYDEPPYPRHEQTAPGETTEMEMKPDHGENSYVGSGKLKGKKAIITGGDSGIGRAIAIAFSREGADVVISYLNESDDAETTRKYVEAEGRKALLMEGDIGDEQHCQKIVETTVREFGKIDILVNNAAFQQSRESLQDIEAEEWEYTFRTNIHSIFYLCKAAEPHMKPGSSIINTTSVNAYSPLPILLPYAATKAAIQNFTANLAQLVASKGIRVNCVAPGPIWTPLIPATMPADSLKDFGKDTPMNRAGQPAEVAPVYVMLASDDASYISGATIPVTGGMITI